MPFKFKNVEDIRRYVDCIRLNLKLPATVEIELNGINIRVTYDAADADFVRSTIEEYCIPHGLMDNVKYHETGE